MHHYCLNMIDLNRQYPIYSLTSSSFVMIFIIHAHFFKHQWHLHLNQCNPDNIDISRRSPLKLYGRRKSLALFPPFHKTTLRPRRSDDSQNSDGTRRPDRLSHKIRSQKGQNSSFRRLYPSSLSVVTCPLARNGTRRPDRFSQKEQILSVHRLCPSYFYEPLISL